MQTRTKTLRYPCDCALEIIARQIQQRRFLQALREIEEVKRDAGLDLTRSQKGDLAYLASHCLHELGRYETALASAKFAYEAFKDTAENKKVAQIQFRLGRINLSLGNLRSAEVHLTDALSTYRRLGDHAEMVRLYNRIARIHCVRCDFEKSIEYLNEAKALSDNIGDPEKAAFAAGNLGTVYALLGEWREAEENLEASYASHRSKGDELNMCRALLSRGLLACLRRDCAGSKAFLSEAIKLADKNRFIREKAIYHEYAGQLAQSEGDEKAAEGHLIKALEIGRMAAPEGDITSQTYRLLAELQVNRRNFDDALMSCHKSLKVSISLGEKLEEGAVYRVLGQIYSAKGEREKTRQHFEKGLSLLQRIGAKYELARTYLEAGRSNSFDYYKRLGLLSNADGLFRHLESKFHLGSVNLAVADLLLEQMDCRSAEAFLGEAERLFKESNGQRELRRVADRRRAVEEALFQHRLTAKCNGELTFDNVITENAEMMEIIEKLKRIKDYEMSILVEGETGTGKDLIAKAVHYSSSRKDRRFVAVNCAALPETLLENELFGHRRGAYTGANKDHPGLFEEAEGGTLYLDQVEEMPNSTQVKLLRAIEEKEITRLGETRPRKINVRIISSSIQDLKAAVENGKFRQDLYFRLNTFHLKLPPLSQRKEDIAPLVKHFFREYGVEEKSANCFQRNGMLEKFREYHWPGNVRELENEIKRVVILAQANDRDAQLFLSEKLDFPAGGEVSGRAISLPDRVARLERDGIAEALKRSNGNKAQAARRLGIPEGTLRSKMKKYGMFQPVSSGVP